jgi:hypothetical protein
MLDKEMTACTPLPVQADGFNVQAILPYGLEVQHIRQAMEAFIDFLGFINWELHRKGIHRLELLVMPATFSSIVSEFMAGTLPKYCSSLIKNRHHNGYPDLLPRGYYTGDSVLRGQEGIEVKASRYRSGWQGHNPEDGWLIVFVFDANSSRDEVQGVEPRSFRFVEVVGAKLRKSDWRFSGRSGTSRRTITASVQRSGFDKMRANWIYRVSE